MPDRWRIRCSRLSYIAIDNFYTATVYNKGAEVIRMMHTLLGKAAFRRGMDLYFARHDNQAVTIDDFAQAMQDASGIDLARFRRWYHQAGTPEVAVSDNYDAATRRYTLTVTQRTPPTPGQPDKQPVVIPLAMGLLDGSAGRENRRTARVAARPRPSRASPSIDVPNQPTPSLLRGFSAPVKLSGLTSERLRFLAAHDTDPFVRWESGQQYATRTAAGDGGGVAPWRDAGARPGTDRGDGGDPALADADPAFAAEALACRARPSWPIRWRSPMSMRSTRCARARARRSARELRDALHATYQRLTDTGPYQIDGVVDRPPRVAQHLPGLSAAGATPMASRWPRRSSMPDRT